MTMPALRGGPYTTSTARPTPAGGHNAATAPSRYANSSRSRPAR
jgi:hypothetical protein